MKKVGQVDLHFIIISKWHKVKGSLANYLLKALWGQHRVMPALASHGVES